MGRVLIKTEKTGYFKNVEDPEGKSVRKKADDQIFDNLLEAQEALAVLKASGNEPGGNGASADEPKNEGKTEAKAEKPPKKEKPPKEPLEKVELSTGKVALGKTVTIKCQWKDPETKKVCGKERKIKPQDVFQVKFCVDHRDEAKRIARNDRARARTATKKAEAEKKGGGKAAKDKVAKAA